MAECLGNTKGKGSSVRIISIANQKGGCGKTTTSINLAAALTFNGKRVLLIDLDPQAHASLGLNIVSQNSIYNVISKVAPKKLSLDQVILKVRDGLDLVPSNVLVGTLEQELFEEIGRELKLTGILTAVQDRYDYVIIDCPPNLGFLTVNAFRACTELIIPVEPSRFSIQGVERLMDIVQLMKDRLSHTIEARVLITMFDSRLDHCFKMQETIRKNFENRIINTIVHLNVKLKEAAVQGKTVLEYDKYCRGSKDYFSLAKEIICGEDGQKREFSLLSNRMRKEVKEKTRDFIPTLFSLNAPQAQSVYIAGDFNNWYVDESCRMHQKDGLWKAQLELKPGTYQYRFIIDGRWQEDPANPRKTENTFGDANSVVEVAG